MGKRRTRSRVANSARATSQRRRGNFRWLAGLGGVALGAIIVALILSAVFGGSDTISSKTAAGSLDQVPNFSFTLYQGESKLGAEKMDFAQLHGKPIVLNFWAGLCPPCRAEMPDLQRFYDESKNQVTLIGIDIGPFMGLGSHRDAQNLLRELNITYPAGFTNDGSVVRKYEVLGMPTTVFIDSQGKMFEKWTGALNRDILTPITNAILKQEARSGS